MNERQDGSLRLLFVISSYRPLVGGGEMQAERLAEVLAARGHQVTVLTRLAVPGTAAAESRNGVRVVRVAGGGRWGYTLAMLRWIRQNRGSIDLIHAQQSHSPLVVGSIAARLWSIPLVCTPMTRYPELNWLTGSPRTLFRRWLFARTDWWVAKSDEIASALEAYAPGRITRNPNGVDLHRFRPGPERESGEPVAIFVGRLEAPKRVDLLLEAWRHWAGRGRLLIVGEGSKRAEWEAQAAQMGLEGVEFLGRRSDVDELFRLADLFVLVSDFEGMPNALLEAMSSGLPSVASGVGAIPELLADGAGVIVPPGSAHELAAALKSLLDDPAVRRSMGRRARQKVMDQYGLESVVDRVEAVYKKMRMREG